MLLLFLFDDCLLFWSLFFGSRALSFYFVCLFECYNCWCLFCVSVVFLFWVLKFECYLICELCLWICFFLFVHFDDLYDRLLFTFNHVCLLVITFGFSCFCFRFCAIFSILAFDFNFMCIFVLMIAFVFLSFALIFENGWILIFDACFWNWVFFCCLLYCFMLLVFVMLSFS